MGFMVLASVLWLVWVFAAQTNEFSLFFLLIALYFLGIGSWVYGKWATPSRSQRARIIGTVTALTLLVASVEVIHIASTSLAPSIEQKGEIADAWEPYSAARIAELQKQGIPVIVDFTAKWCLICQANHMVLSTDDVSSKLDDLGVVRMKADWTRNDPEITEALTQFGRNSVPLYLLYGTNTSDSPAILPQVLTPDIVMEELDRLSGPIAENGEA
jgi:thiol:disulfide interchange protein DsbD